MVVPTIILRRTPERSSRPPKRATRPDPHRTIGPVSNLLLRRTGSFASSPMPAIEVGEMACGSGKTLVFTALGGVMVATEETGD